MKFLKLGDDIFWLKRIHTFSILHPPRDLFVECAGADDEVNVVGEETVGKCFGDWFDGCDVVFQEYVGGDGGTVWACVDVVEAAGF